MTDVYKVWVQIERVDDDLDRYENVTEEIEIGRFATCEAAESFVVRIESLFEQENE